jgi:ATP-binding cassette subfamily F protein uup
MNYLLAENVSKTYGDRTLFAGIDLSINKGQKIGLIARNGSGKTTFLNILAGIDVPDLGGSVRIAKGVKLAYLSQQPFLDSNSTVLETVLATNTPALSAIRTYQTALIEHEQQGTEQSQKSLTAAMEAVQVLGAWDAEARVKEILTRFKLHRLDERIGNLSGGDQKRVALASVILQEADFMILDEPTNHLDLEIIEWLEEYLSRPNITLLLVTHDRYFLDRVTDEIIEIEQATLQRYRGNYSYYLEKKSELQFNLKQETEKAQKLMKRELEWIRTQPKARTTKSKSRIDAFENIKQKATVKVDTENLGFAGIKMERIGGRTVELFNVDKRFGDAVILKDFTYLFKRSDRVGIVGNNGTGKTTLMNLITGKEKPDSGTIGIGKTVEFGYYTQTGLQTEKDKKVIEVIQDIAEGLPLEKGKFLTAPQLLNFFQFPYSQHEAYISTLSGGELRRLYLLTILMRNPNFLILDEPTNDLDLLTLGVLEDFLMHFQGCLIIVSHDRYFMDRLVDHVFVLEGNGKVRDFPGHYSHYRAARDYEEQQERERRELIRLASAPETNNTHRNTEKRKLSYNEQRELAQIERDLETLEQEKEQLNAKLLSGTVTNHQDLLHLSERIGEVVQQIDTKTDRWLYLSEFA